MKKLIQKGSSMLNITANDDGSATFTLKLKGLILLAFLILICLGGAITMSSKLVDLTRQSKNGCSREYPYLLQESATSSTYYFQADKIINRQTGELITAQEPDNTSMWIVRSQGEKYLCISTTFYDRLLEEFNSSEVPSAEFPSGPSVWVFLPGRYASRLRYFLNQVFWRLAYWRWAICTSLIHSFPVISPLINFNISR